MADYQSTSYQQRRLAHRPATRPASATATQTIRQTPLLRLRAEPEEPAADRRRIQWAEDVVDNEGMGKKKSKVCCIYHAPHPVGESSSESSSDSSSDSDSNSGIDDDGTARMGGKGKERRQQQRRGEHEHGDNNDEHVSRGQGCEHNHSAGTGGEAATSPRQTRKEKSGNAYDVMPRHRRGVTGSQR